MASTSSLSSSFSSSKQNSLLVFPPELRRQYRNLNIFAFSRYWFYSYYSVFQPLYLITRLQLWQLFINWSLSSILSLLIQNYWSKKVDDTQRIKRYILISNLTAAFAAIYTIYVSSFLMLLAITIIMNISPNGDLLTNVLVYRLSDRVTDRIEDPVEKKYHNINIYAHYRRYGSIGWALALPVMGLAVNAIGFRSGMTFWVCALGLVVVSIWFMHAISEGAILTSQDKTKKTTEKSKASPKEKKKDQQSLWQKYRALFSVQVYFSFILVTAVYYIAYASTNQVQGLFYNLLLQNDYFKLSLVYSIAAFAEFPAMTIVAKQVKRIGWEKVIVLVYVLAGIRLAILPLILILNADIFWGYLLQAYSGALFGFTWPTTTFGLYISLPDDQKALGQSFLGTVNAVGTCLGLLLGAAISVGAVNQNLAYYYLYWICGAIAIFSGFLFLLLQRRNTSKETIANKRQATGETTGLKDLQEQRAQHVHRVP